MNKNEGKMKILEMISEGKITPDEAMELLKHFENDNEKDINQDYDFIDGFDNIDNSAEGFSQRVENFSQRVENFGQNLGERITNFVSDFMDKDIVINFSDTFKNGYKGYFNYTSETILDINSIKLIGKNAPVQIKGYEGDIIKIECEFNCKNPNWEIKVNDENGNYELAYDYDSMRSMKIKCLVPFVYIQNIDIESKNYSIHASNLKGEKFKFASKNGSISIDNIDSNYLLGQTSNASITSSNINAKDIELITKNATINAYKIESNELFLITSNASIKIDDIDTHNLYLKTSNASLRLNNFLRKTDWEGERNVEIISSNGKIDVDLPKDVYINLRTQTSTSSRINCNLDSVDFKNMSKNYINAISTGYENSNNKLKLNITTSNGNIDINN